MSTKQGYCTIMNPSHREGCIHCSRQDFSHLETVRICRVMIMTGNAMPGDAGFTHSRLGIWANRGGMKEISKIA